MGNTDSIPVISQVKSLVQVASGDEQGAKVTQQNFLRTGPIASQVYSAVLAIGVSIVLLFYPYPGRQCYCIIG